MNGDKHFHLHGTFFVGAVEKIWLWQKMSFSYVLSPRLKPKHSATKMFAASEIAAHLTQFFAIAK